MFAYLAVAFKQMPILIKKNFILTKRNLKSTIIQLLVPFIFVLGLYVLQVGLNANQGNDAAISDLPNSIPEPIQKIVRCINGKGATQPCITIAYSSNDDDAHALVETVRVENDIPSSEIRYFNSSDALDVFMDANNNVTQGAYNFNISTSIFGTKTYGFAVQWNQSNFLYDLQGKAIEPAYSTVIPMVYSMQRAIVKLVSGNPNFDYSVQMLPFPHPALRSSDAIQTNGPSFFFAALMFNLVVQLGQIVSEKELKLRDYMSLMGLKNVVFWGSWWVTNTVMNTLSVMILIISGYIFQFEFFLKNAFGSFFFLFFLFGVALVPFTFVFSTLIKEARTATSLGFVIFLFGVILQSFATFAFAEDFYPFWRFVFSLMPFALLGKGIGDISDMSSGAGSTGFKWADRGTNDWWSLNDTYAWLMYDFIIYFILAWYLDNVIPNSHGVRRPPWFFLTPSYWVGSKKKKNQSPTVTHVEERQDEDVVKEREDIIAGNLDEAVVLVKALYKTYNEKKLGCIPNKDGAFTAVAGTYWHIDAGSLFCLLGHNGAGKTTTINMMTGMFAPTSGDATIFGHSILDEMEDIRKLMGVCPQHDILWDQLTGREHLEFFAGLRGLPRSQIQSEVNERLKDVELVTAGEMVSSSYSGGMKRRHEFSISESAEAIFAYANPTESLALHKACFAFCLFPQLCVEEGRQKISEFPELCRKFLGNSGFELATDVDIPKGSGLGTSSILMLGCVRAIRKYFQLESNLKVEANLKVENKLKVESEDLDREMNAVLAIEQMLTTGGGWQDQIGGGIPGIKFTTTKSGPVPHYQVEDIELDQDHVNVLNERLIVVYTGKTRLAKTVLYNVVDNWCLRREGIMEILLAIKDRARDMHLVFKEFSQRKLDEISEIDSDFSKLGFILNQIRKLNIDLEKSISNDYLDTLFSGIDEFVTGSNIIGAGSGGFILGYLKRDQTREALRQYLKKNFPEAEVSDMTLDLTL